MIDFTAHRHPVLALPCPDCGRRAGVMCHRPSGHKASDFHARRKTEADRQFIAQHGAGASLERVEGRWQVDPEGRARQGAARRNAAAAPPGCSRLDPG